MKRLIIGFSLLALLSFNTSPSVKQARYNVLKGGKVIGQMISSRSEDQGLVLYTTESNVKITGLINISIHNKIQSSFKNGLLLNSSMLRVVNGKTKNTTQITRNAGGYLVTDADGKIRQFNPDIQLSTACLMHTEPKGYQQIYSENFRQFVAIELISTNKYALKLPDGDNYYTYKNGICVEVEVPTTFATIFIRADEGLVTSL